MPPRNRKPEQDQAAEEIAATQDAESASVTDSGPVPGQTEVFVGEEGETSEGVLPPGGADEQPAAEGEATPEVEVTEEVEVTIEESIEVEIDDEGTFNPGDAAPAPGLYVALGVEVEMDEGERFPPLAHATRWARVQDS